MGIHSDKNGGRNLTYCSVLYIVRTYEMISKGNNLGQLEEPTSDPCFFFFFFLQHASGSINNYKSGQCINQSTAVTVNPGAVLIGHYLCVH
jgi:hypothetical protein